ncbi:MAG: hypothetical protein Aurels2KO_10430 [Aureliella sp.]
MARIYGHEKDTAERLTEIATAPQNVGRAFLRPQRQPRTIGGGGGELVYCVTPSGGIPAMTVSGGAYVFGESACTVVGSDGNTTSETITVVNSVSGAIAGDILIGVASARDFDNKYGIVVGNCPPEQGSS